MRHYDPMDRMLERLATKNACFCGGGSAPPTPPPPVIIPPPPPPPPPAAVAGDTASAPRAAQLTGPATPKKARNPLRTDETDDEALGGTGVVSGGLNIPK